MLITCTCPNEVGQTLAHYPNNNNFLAVFSEDFRILPYSKICVHSAYVSYAPLITIVEDLNDEFAFTVFTPSINDSFTCNVPASQYTPQQLADALTFAINTALTGGNIPPDIDEVSVQIDWDVITGSYEFIWLFQQPSAGATSGERRITISWGLNATTQNLGRIMGFVSGNNTLFPNTQYNRISNLVMNDQIPEMALVIEGDYSMTYTTNANATPVCYISIENINSKSWNNYSHQALKFLEVLRFTYPQNLNNSFILPYEKSWIQLDNDNEMLFNSLEITLRNLDGTLFQNVDTSKQAIIIFEIVQDLERQKQIMEIKAIQAQQKIINDEIMIREFMEQEANNNEPIE